MIPVLLYHPFHLGKLPILMPQSQTSGPCFFLSLTLKHTSLWYIYMYICMFIYVHIHVCSYMYIYIYEHWPQIVARNVCELYLHFLESSHQAMKLLFTLNVAHVSQQGVKEHAKVTSSKQSSHFWICLVFPLHSPWNPKNECEWPQVTRNEFALLTKGLTGSSNHHETLMSSDLSFFPSPALYLVCLWAGWLPLSYKKEQQM